MKPAKYKAKDLKGKWVYGTPIETRPSIDNKFGFHKWWMIEIALSHGGYFYICKRSAIREETLCQQTRFKDIEGKDIYYNDILIDNEGRKWDVIINGSGGCSVNSENLIAQSLYQDGVDRMKFKVIGNKYD